MTNFIKFSQFSEANLNDATTETVGLASGQNIKTPKVVSWTTAARPTPPVAWVIGANTDLGQYEFWNPNSSSWVQLTSSVDLTSTYILKTPDATLPNSFALSTLSTGILKSQTLTGDLSISAPLTSIDSLVTSANEMLYTTGADTYAVSSLTPFSRGLLALATAPAWAAALNVPTIPVTVNEGGTGDTSFVPFSVLCGGTAATNPIQSVLSVGTAGQILTSNGAGALPTWTNSASIGIVNPGLINELAYYAANGSAVSGLPTASNGTLVTDNSGVPSISSTLPNAVQLNITALGTVGTGVWQGSIIGLAYGGTNANLTASAGAISYSTASALALSSVGTTGQLLQSNGAGAPTWTTASFPGTVGSVGTILRSNGTNWVASSSAFADTYTASDLLYSNGANNVVGLATANNGVLITSGAGIPSISSTLPAAVQGNITAVGTITSGVWNGTAIDVSHGGTGDTSFTAYSVICAGTTSTGNFQNVSGLGSIGQVLTSAGPAALPTWSNASGTGTVNSGGINQLAYYAAAGNTVSGLATANDGLLVTSSTGVPSILAGPGTTGNVLQSNTGAAPSFSTAAYPSTATGTGKILRADGSNWVPSTSTFADTYAINTLLYNASANTVSGLATANNGLLVTSSTGVPSILAGPGTTGKMLQSNAAAAPSFSTATFPGTAGAAGTILRSDGTNWLASTSTFADTYSINTILYNASANTVSGLATAASSVLVTSAGGVPSLSTTLPANLIIPTPKITTSLLDSNGNTWIGETAAASAVNYFNVANSATGLGISISALGTDTNINLNVIAKGTGSFVAISNGANVLIANNPSASAVNYIAFQGSTTGNSPLFAPVGTDTNIILQLNGKGTGGVALSGTSTNDNAAAGYVGEYLSSSVGAGGNLTTGTITNVTSLSITAGDWDVGATIVFAGGATTLLYSLISTISTANNTQSAVLNTGILADSGGTLFSGYAPNNLIPVSTPSIRLSLASTTTYYLNAIANFTTSTTNVSSAILWARRRR